MRCGRGWAELWLSAIEPKAGRLGEAPLMAVARSEGCPPAVPLYPVVIGRAALDALPFMLFIARPPFERAALKLFCPFCDKFQQIDDGSRSYWSPAASTSVPSMMTAGWCRSLGGVNDGVRRIKARACRSGHRRRASAWRPASVERRVPLRSAVQNA